MAILQETKPRILLIFICLSAVPERTVRIDDPKIDPLFVYTRETRPWSGLLWAAWHKRQKELDRGRLYEKIIAVYEHGYDEVKIRRMIEMPLARGIILCEAVRPPNPQHNDLQWATPRLFCANSVDFSRAAEFERSRVVDSESLRSMPIETQFYHHLKAMSLSVQQLTR